jgi:RNA binding exosome subunit
MYPFATFEAINGQDLFTLCVKYISLRIINRQKGDTKYYVRFDKDKMEVEVSKETYSDIDNLMVECNKKFDRANLNGFSPASG